MKEIFFTENSQETKKLGEMLSRELRGGEIICLEGELGAGKTTFTQGLLKGLGAEGPYTSPTFLVMKHYKKEFPISKSQFPKKSQIFNVKIQNIYHIDVYRVNAADILSLGWEEIANNKNNVIIIEWAERITDIVPKGSLWVEFRWVDENKREITFKNS